MKDVYELRHRCIDCICPRYAEYNESITRVVSQTFEMMFSWVFCTIFDLIFVENRLEK